MNRKGVGNSAPGAAFSPNQFAASEGVRESNKLQGTDFAPDIELEQGFPDKKTSYSTKPCLEDVQDKYTEADKARAIHKKLQNGMQDAFGGDKDFLAVAQAS